VSEVAAAETYATDVVEAAGHFRIYLGAAAGVGKTYAMLNEGHRRKGRGTDVVIGFVECHGRRLTEELINGLEVVPRKAVAAAPDHPDRDRVEPAQVVAASIRRVKCAAGHQGGRCSRHRCPRHRPARAARRRCRREESREELVPTGNCHPC
jgi:hypothetical protein